MEVNIERHNNFCPTSLDTQYTVYYTHNTQTTNYTEHTLYKLLEVGARRAPRLLVVLYCIQYSNFRNYAPTLDEKGGIITEKSFPYIF